MTANQRPVVDYSVQFAKIQSEIKANDAVLASQKKGTTHYLEAEKKKYELIEQLRNAKITQRLAANIQRVNHNIPEHWETGLAEAASNNMIAKEKFSSKTWDWWRSLKKKIRRNPYLPDPYYAELVELIESEQADFETRIQDLLNRGGIDEQDAFMAKTMFMEMELY